MAKLLLVFCGLWTFGFCHLCAQPGPVRIILDTDMGSDCDDVGAMALLHHYVHNKSAELIGVIYSSGAVPYGVGVIDAINRYYGRADIPIGANHDAGFGDPVDKMQAEKLALDTAAFGHRLVHNLQAPEQTRLNRQLLSAQPDRSVVYVTIGHTKALYDLLRSPADTISSLTGAELVERKIDRWVALGALGAGNPEGKLVKDWNFFFNGTAHYTEYLLHHFPRPAFFVDSGSDVLTGGSLAHSPSGNIVRTAYRDWLWQVEKKTLADQRPSWDLAAVCFAVEGPGTFFNIRNDGYLQFDAQQGCRWVTMDTAKEHHYVMQRHGVSTAMATYFNRLIMLPD